MDLHLRSKILKKICVDGFVFSANLHRHFGKWARFPNPSVWSTVKAAFRKIDLFYVIWIYNYIYIKTFSSLNQNIAWQMLIDSLYKLVTWWVGHVVLVNNPREFGSHLIFDIARTNQFKKMLTNVLNI